MTWLLYCAGAATAKQPRTTGTTSRCIKLQCIRNCHIFTALHWMHGGLVRRKLPVCLYVCQTRGCDKTEESSVQNFIPYERPFSLVFWKEEWLVGATHSPEILGHLTPVGAKSPILNRCSLVAPHPWHLAKKVQVTLIRSPLRAFQWV